MARHKRELSAPALSATSEFVAQVRETRPAATEVEVWLLERLIGSLGMVRRLMTHGSYMIDGQDGFEVVNEFLLGCYGWKLHWHDEEPKTKRRKVS